MRTVSLNPPPKPIPPPGQEFTEGMPLLTPMLWAALLGLLGAAFLVGGVYLLWGEGWALLACSLLCFCLVALLLRGIIFTATARPPTEP